MRRLVMWNLMTLDGHFEGTKPWDLEFHMTAWGEEMEALGAEQERTTGAVLFGRKTYVGMAKYWSKDVSSTGAFMNTVPKIVFSRTLESADWKNTRLVSSEAADEVERLKREPGKDLFVFGSATLSGSLIARGLFDEYRICIAPILLGAGVPLFKPSAEKRRLKLLDARALKTGAVILRYAPFEE